jgi:hypothetical protein
LTQPLRATTLFLKSADKGTLSLLLFSGDSVRDFLRGSWAYLAGATALLLAGPVAAQTVTGEVVDAGSLSPLRGAFVSLLDQDHRQLVGALTDQEGQFRLRAPGSGRYVLRASRLGYESVATLSIQLDESGVVHRFELPRLPIELPDLVVTGTRSECATDPEEGRRVLELWESVRTAAEVAVWTEETGYLRLNRIEYTRTLDPVSGRVRSERTRRSSTMAGPAFRAVPADRLVTEGAVEEDGDGWIFYGIDASTLASDAFLDAHCLGILASSGTRDDRLGLTFRPRSGHSVPSVRGILWLSRETLELRRVEYQWTWMPWAVPEASFGGETEFRRLPNGAWIVERWNMRLPVLERIPQRIHEPRTAHAQLDFLRREGGLVVQENAGEVSAIYTQVGVRLPGPDRAALGGLVFDSLAGGPLAGARVRLEGTVHVVITDHRGRYRFEDLPAGRYGVTFQHPVLRGWGIEAPMRQADLMTGEVTTVDLAVPSAGTVLTAGCEVPSQTTGEARPVVGRVLDEGTGLPLRGALVRLEFPTGPEPGESGRLEVRTDTDGAYRFCAVAGEEPVRLVAEFPGMASVERRVTVAGKPHVFEEFTMRPGRAMGLSGQVLDEATGEPITGVQVTLMPGGRNAISDSDGRFGLEGVSPGGHRVEVRHMAYRTVRDSLWFDATEGSLRVEIRMDREAIPLEAITVSVERGRPPGGVLARVFERADRVRAMGIGSVFYREDIERRGAQRLTHILAQAPGIRITQQSVGGRNIPVVVTTRAFSGFDQCMPLFYLDGAPYALQDHEGRFLGESVDDLMSTQEIELIEVYPSASQVPAEFSGSRAGCGVVAIWTRRDG